MNTYFSTRENSFGEVFFLSGWERITVLVHTTGTW